MSNPKDIDPRNEGGYSHGYCKGYHSNGQLFWKGVYVNGQKYGYHDCYNDGGVSIYLTGYWLDGNKVSTDNADGNCIIWGRVEL